MVKKINLLTEVVPHPDTTNLGPVSISELVLRVMGETVELFRSKGSSNLSKHTSLFVVL